jgi:alkylhydroperoxidase family enzyme
MQTPRRLLLRLIEPRIRAQERRLGASLDYLRDLLRVSGSAFLKFTLVTPVSGHRRVLPADAYSAARIAVVREADCGTCLQIEVNLAREAGVPAELARALLQGQPDDLPAHLREVVAFALAVTNAQGTEERWRAGLLQRYGEEGLAELSLAIAMARVFPTVKRGLGHATSCSAVHLELE